MFIICWEVSIECISPRVMKFLEEEVHDCRMGKVFKDFTSSESSPEYVYIPMTVPSNADWISSGFRFWNSIGN